MFYSPRLYFRDLFISIPLAFTIAAQIFIWWKLLSGIRPTSENIFLHSNIIFGVDLWGEWWQAFFVPLGGLLLLAINYGISYFAYRSDKLLSRTFSSITFLFHIFLVIASILIVELNV